MNSSYRIDGMHCGGCVAKVKRTLEGIPGVVSASVSLPNVARLESSTAIDLHTIESYLKAVGSYSVHEGGILFFERVRTFAPLIAMFGIVILWSTVANYLWGHHPYHDWMRFCMGGFFVLFGLLKVVNLWQFAEMFRGYDIVARRIPAWGYVYPFVELEVGILYTFDLYSTAANVATMVVMTIGTIGIVQKLRSGTSQTCACLGGFFSVPLTRVTVVENVAMVLMAAWMQLFH